jgi:hypothetical protein
MSVEEGSAPNSGSEGDSASLGLDPDDLEDPRWDFASFTCLRARISEKDILLLSHAEEVQVKNLTSANTVNFPSNSLTTVKYYTTTHF